MAEQPKPLVFGHPITDPYQSEDIMLFCHPSTDHLTHTRTHTHARTHTHTHSHSIRLHLNSVLLLSRTENCRHKCWYIGCNICWYVYTLYSTWFLSNSDYCINMSHKCWKKRIKRWENSCWFPNRHCGFKNLFSPFCTEKKTAAENLFSPPLLLTFTCHLQKAPA